IDREGPAIGGCQRQLVAVDRGDRDVAEVAAAVVCRDDRDDRAHQCERERAGREDATARSPPGSGSCSSLSFHARISLEVGGPLPAALRTSYGSAVVRFVTGA